MKKLIFIVFLFLGLNAKGQNNYMLESINAIEAKINCYFGSNPTPFSCLTLFDTTKTVIESDTIIFGDQMIFPITLANWSTAYSWGDHLGLYRPISYVPAWSEVTGKPSFHVVATSGDYDDLSDKPVVPSNLLGSHSSVYSSGTTYTLTTSTAKIDFGTTDPSITIPAAGTYLILANLKIEYSGLTTALNACSFKLRRTNNTAADLTNAVTSFNVPAVTLLTGTGGDVDIPSIIYTTSNSDDVIELWGNRSAGLTLGAINVGEASIVAIRLY